MPDPRRTGDGGGHAGPPAGVPRVVITGVGASTAFGRGTGPLRAGTLAGEPAFGPVTRFRTDGCRVGVAALLPGRPVLADELAAVLSEACEQAALGPGLRGDCPLLVALHSDSGAAREPGAPRVTGASAERLAADCGMPPPLRTYVAACVAGSNAVADAATMITTGAADRVAVAGGFLVDADSQALFDAGRALATDGQVRPFSSGRKGMLLGDGAAAVICESDRAAAARGAEPLATLAGWGRAGDAYHVCQPRPDGSGCARAIGAALRRAGAAPDEVCYVNANGTGTSFSDAAESAALHLALGTAATRVPVSSTKSLHGHSLEASGLVELVATVLALRAGMLPINAGFLGPDRDCVLHLIRPLPRQAGPGYALSLNSAFGGANTALLVGAA
jgi:3-oxoacyl-[acyl-carrier-protein] synthase II